MAQKLHGLDYDRLVSCKPAHDASMIIFLILNALVTLLMTLMGFVVALDPSEPPPAPITDQERQSVAIAFAAVFAVLFTQSCSVLWVSVFPVQP